MAQESAAFKQRARELGGINKGEKGVHRLSATKRLCEFHPLLILFVIHRPNDRDPHAPLLLLRPRVIPTDTAQGRAVNTVLDAASAVRYPGRRDRCTHAAGKETGGD